MLKIPTGGRQIKRGLGAELVPGVSRLQVRRPQPLGHATSIVVKYGLKISDTSTWTLVSHAAVICLVTQRSSPQTAAETWTTFLAHCVFFSLYFYTAPKSGEHMTKLTLANGKKIPLKNYILNFTNTTWA